MGLNTSGAVLLGAVYITWILYVDSTGMLKPDPNPDLNADAEKIKNALDDWDDQRDVFKQILPRRTCPQRNEIFMKLPEDMRKDKWEYNKISVQTSTGIYIVVLNSFFCGADFYIGWLRYITANECLTDVKTLIELLVLNSFEEESVRQKFIDEASKIMEDTTFQLDWENKWSYTFGIEDDYCNWVEEMLTRGRAPANTPTNPEEAKADAKLLIEEMNKGFDNNRQVMDKILAEKTLEQANLTLQEFKTLNNNVELMDVVKDQLHGFLENAYCDLLTYIREGRTIYLAVRLKEGMDGMGTEDSTVGRIIVYASETDLLEVNDAYKQRYGKTLVERVGEETSDFEKDFLFAFMGQN